MFFLIWINATILTKCISDDASSAQKWLKASRGCSFSPAKEKGLHSVATHPQSTPTVHNLFRPKEKEADTLFFFTF